LASYFKTGKALFVSRFSPEVLEGAIKLKEAGLHQDKNKI
jgi:hypothetical protein